MVDVEVNLPESLKVEGDAGANLGAGSPLETPGSKGSKMGSRLLKFGRFFGKKSVRVLAVWDPVEGRVCRAAGPLCVRSVCRLFFCVILRFDGCTSSTLEVFCTQGGLRQIVAIELNIHAQLFSVYTPGIMRVCLAFYHVYNACAVRTPA